MVQHDRSDSPRSGVRSIVKPGDLEPAMLCISREPIATFDCRPGLCPGAGLWTLVRRRRLGVREPCSRFCPGSHASRHHDGHQVLDVHRHRCFIPTMTHGSMFQWWRQGQQRHRPTPSMARLLKAGAWLPHSTVRLRQTKSSGKKRPNSRARTVSGRRSGIMYPASSCLRVFVAITCVTPH